MPDLLLENLIIPHRFNGPPHSANGGWAAGLLAGQLLRHTVAQGLAGKIPASPINILPKAAGGIHAGIAVSLRAPPPLDTGLQVLALDDGSVTLCHGEQLLAQAEFSEVGLAMPDLPAIPTAREAGGAGFGRARSRASWPYARCFGCGVARDDGLCITPGPCKDAGDTGLIAATWTPPVWLARDAGQVPVEAVWAALDCPAGIAWSYRLPDGAPMVTASMTLSIEALPEAGTEYMVLGWPISREGRKLHAGTALVDRQGRVLARSRQLWLVPRDTV